MNVKIMSIIFVMLSLLNIAHAQGPYENCLNDFHPAAAKSLVYLKEWEGRYSFDKDTRTGKSFFQLPEIREQLSKLLSKNDFRLLTKVYGVDFPIELYENYLVIQKCKPHDCPIENAMLVVNLENGSINVAFFRMYGSKTETRWINSNWDQYHLPEDIKALLYYGHNPYLGSIPEHKMPLRNYINESKYCLKKSDYSKALQFVDQGIKYYPNSAKLFAFKAYILKKMGKSNEASASLGEILKLNPDY